MTTWQYLAGVDPGFPIGGAPTLIGGGTNLQHRCFLVKTYVKTKEFGPVWGGMCQKLLYVDLPLPSTSGDNSGPGLITIYLVSKYIY